MGRHFPVKEKSGNFEKTGKVRENHTKYWKTFSDIEMNCVLFAKMDKVFSLKKKPLKNPGKIEKNTGKVGEFC